MPTNLTKLCIDELLPVITRIIKTPLFTGQVISPFKNTYVVTPLIKKHDLDLKFLTSYRFGSNISSLSKILEKNVVLRQPLQFLDLINIKEFFFPSDLKTIH